ncbi:MAG: NlpC/P60 family protein [Pseudomonadota bacterium]
MSGGLDARRYAFRADLADVELREQVAAPRYAAAAPRICAAPTAPLRSAPDLARPAVATLLLGEPVKLFELSGAWAWVQSARDGYVGYAAAAALAPPDPAARATHRVSVPRTHLYPAPDFKTPPLGWAPLGGRLCVSAVHEGRFVKLGGRGAAPEAWVAAAHLSALDHAETDFVAVAERLEHAPYLWGGESVEGVDCSGLIQLALEQTGAPCPRDSDMQEEELGAAAPLEGPRRRGDLVFWKGHVGVMVDDAILLHANAGAMRCAREPLDEAIERIEAAGEGRPTSARRLRTPF